MCPVAWSTATSWDMVPRDVLFWQLPPWFVGHFTLCRYPNNLQVTLLNLLFLHGETWLYTLIPIDFISLRSSNFPVLSTLLLILPSCFIHFDPYFFQFSALFPCEKKSTFYRFPMDRPPRREVEVTGFANSDLSRGRANGVAVPDVDIVAGTKERWRGGSAPPVVRHRKIMGKTCEILGNHENSWKIWRKNWIRIISIHPSIYLSVCLSTNLSIYLSLYLSICLSIYLSIYLNGQWWGWYYRDVGIEKMTMTYIMKIYMMGL